MIRSLLPVALALFATETAVARASPAPLIVSRTTPDDARSLGLPPKWIVEEPGLQKLFVPGASYLRLREAWVQDMWDFPDSVHVEHWYEAEFESAAPEKDLASIVSTMRAANLTPSVDERGDWRYQDDHLFVHALDEGIGLAIEIHVRPRGATRTSVDAMLAALPRVAVLAPLPAATGWECTKGEIVREIGKPPRVLVDFRHRPNATAGGSTFQTWFAAHGFKSAGDGKYTRGSGVSEVVVQAMAMSTLAVYSPP